MLTARRAILRVLRSARALLTAVLTEVSGDEAQGKERSLLAMVAILALDLLILATVLWAAHFTLPSLPESSDEADSPHVLHDQRLP